MVAVGRFSFSTWHVGFFLSQASQFFQPLVSGLFSCSSAFDTESSGALACLAPPPPSFRLPLVAKTFLTRASPAEIAVVHQIGTLFFQQRINRDVLGSSKDITFLGALPLCLFPFSMSRWLVGSSGIRTSSRSCTSTSYHNEIYGFLVRFQED